MSFARRAVLDTGVLVSAAIRPDSVPALALEKALLMFEVCISEETLKELETVLSRSKFDRYMPAPQRSNFVSGFRAHTALIDVKQEVSDCPDPKDNMFLALAGSGSLTGPEPYRARPGAAADNNSESLTVSISEPLSL